MFIKQINIVGVLIEMDCLVLKRQNVKSGGIGWNH